jgi:phosphoribosyl 1,2-cyclic phosphodiesterase
MMVGARIAPRQLEDSRVKLRFLGTRGEIDLRTRRNRMHSSLEISYRGHALMIDCGSDWIHRIRRLRPEAIVLTHAHRDHAWGLKKGAPCPVYAMPETWSALHEFPISVRVSLQPRSPFEIYDMTLEAFRVAHSIRAPAVGYRITAGRSTIFYVPDVAYIYETHEALRGVRLYIGDGASLYRPIIRKGGSALVGHAAIRTQLRWCAREEVPRAAFTHFGSQIVGSDSRTVRKIVRDMGLETNISAEVAFDGLQVVLP